MLLWEISISFACEIISCTNYAFNPAGNLSIMYNHKYKYEFFILVKVIIDETLSIADMKQTTFIRVN